MHANEFIKEIEILPKSHTHFDYRDWTPNTTGKFFRFAAGMTGRIYKKASRMHFDILDKDKTSLVAEVVFTVSQKQGVMQIKSIFVSESQRGKNLAIRAYKFLMKHYNVALQSDSLQTKEGQRLWMKIYQDPQFTVIGYVDASDEYEALLKKFGATLATGNLQKTGDPFLTRYLLPLKIVHKLGRMSFKKDHRQIKLYHLTESNFETGMLAFLKDSPNKPKNISL